MEHIEPIKLTQFSHGAGCGCKIAPSVLDKILHSENAQFQDEHLLVGNQDRDDAAVYDLGNGEAIISTTDFFMPIVDDPFDFGRIAAVNAISDVYAMGGDPMMAIAVLGWPIDKLPPEVAREVVAGGRAACREANIPLAGGHSIDSPEPIFGLAVTGRVDIMHLKKNNTAEAGCQLFLSKPLGVGVLATAMKKGKIQPEHATLALDTMVLLNKLGAQVNHLPGVKAMTDVTGFGLLGHLSEVCEGSRLRAQLYFDKVPVLPPIRSYIDQGCVPGGTKRNWDSYGHKISELSDLQRTILCDPQTSGGLLIAVHPDGLENFLHFTQAEGYALEAIGELLPQEAGQALIEVV